MLSNEMLGWTQDMVKDKRLGDENEGKTSKRQLKGGINVWPISLAQNSHSRFEISKPVTCAETKIQSRVNSPERALDLVVIVEGPVRPLSTLAEYQY